MSQPTETKFFDLHTSGIGYVNRVREVTVRKGKPFMACDIAAMRGDASDVEFTRFDCKVTGEEAEKLIRRCQKAVDEKRKVIIGFRIGDIYTETFTYSSGDKVGQTGVSLKGRLLFIGFIKIDAIEVYKAKPRDSNGQPSASEADRAEPADAPAEPANCSDSDPEIDQILASYGC